MFVYIVDDRSVCSGFVLNNILSIVIFYFYDMMLNNLSLFYVEIGVFFNLSCEILVFIL